jgi:hypothetical protein
VVPTRSDLDPEVLPAGSIFRDEEKSTFSRSSAGSAAPTSRSFGVTGDAECLLAEG